MQGVHDRVLENSMSQRKECISELCFEFRGERARRAHQNIHNSGGASRLLNTLEEELCREAHKIELLENSVELFRRALSRCKCAKVNYVLSSRREVLEEDTHIVMNTL
jgi:hypothetical protein